MQQTVEATSVPSRTVEVAASELPAYIDSLPRMLMTDLTVKVTGTLTEYLYVNRFFGCGNISIVGGGECKLQVGVSIRNCSTIVTLRNLELSGHLNGLNNIVDIQYANKVYMTACTVAGSKSANTEEEIGVRADYSSFVYLTNCGISNCNVAVLAGSSSIVSVYNDSGDGFSGNATGPYVSYGGIILLSGATPELLGGTTSAKAGGLIVKGNGTLL